MDFLQHQFFRNSVREWLIALSIFLGVYIGLRVARMFSVKRLRVFVKKTSAEWDDFLVDLLDSTKSFFFLLVSMIVAASFLEIPDSGWKILRSTFVIGVLFQALMWGQEVIEFIIEVNLEKRKAQKSDPSLATTFGALRFLLRLALYGLIALMVFDNLGFNITALITGLGVGGIAVALATQNILGDLFASLSIVLDKPFIVGDYIELGTNKGHVEKIGIKSTRLRGINGEQVIVSNNDLLSSRIHNFGRIRERRIVQTVGVSYGTSQQALIDIPKLLKSIVEAAPKARFERAHFKSFGESALNFEFVYFVESGEFGDYIDSEQLINFRILESFKNQKIEFAYPTRTIFLQKEAI